MHRLTAEQVRMAVPVVVDAASGVMSSPVELERAALVVDQLGQVPVDAARAVDSLCAFVTGSAEGPRLQVPMRFRLLAMEMLLLHLAGLADRCGHVDSTSPVVGAAHLPGAVCCLLCAESFLALEGDEDNRCDGCGAVEPELWVSVIPVGSLAMSFAVCERCALEGC